MKSVVFTCAVIIALSVSLGSATAAPATKAKPAATTASPKTAPTNQAAQTSVNPTSAATANGGTAVPGASAQPAADSQSASLQIDAGGFKGSIQFPLSLIQQKPSTPATPPPTQPAPATDGYGQPLNAGQYPAQATTGQPPAPYGQMAVPYGAQPMIAPYGAQGSPYMPYGQMPSTGMYPTGSNMMAPNMVAPSAQSLPPAQPALDLNAVGNAAKAIGAGLQNLPRVIDPRLLNQGSKILQSVFPQNPQPVTVPNAATAPPAMVSPEVWTRLTQLLQTAQYNLEQTQEAAYLASFGDPSMRLAAALEAEKNARSARDAWETAIVTAPNPSAQAAGVIASIRDAAGRAQVIADQARAAATSQTGVGQ